jgi:hypothetical protein
MYFDPAVDPIVTNKTPGPGNDILQASANNLYFNVSLADLKGFTEKNGLNSRLVKRPDGTLFEEVYKINGRYSAQITEIVKHLEAAIPFATEPMANALRSSSGIARAMTATGSSTTLHGCRTRPRPLTPSTDSSRCTSIPAA